MDISQIRLNNLMTLINRFRTDREFCELVGISNTYLPQVKGGTKKIGDTLARRIEESLGLAYGWMDQTREPESPPSKDPTLDAIAALPAPLQDQIRRPLFMIAAFCHDESAHEIKPFRITDRNHQDQENDIVRSNNGL